MRMCNEAKAAGVRGVNHHFGGSRDMASCKACGNGNMRMIRIVKQGGKCRVFCVNCAVTTRECDSERQALEDWNAGRVSLVL